MEVIQGNMLSPKYFIIQNTVIEKGPTKEEALQGLKYKMNSFSQQ